MQGSIMTLKLDQGTCHFLQEQIFHLYHWKDNPVCLINIPDFSGDLWAQDLHAVLSTCTKTSFVFKEFYL